MKHHIFYLFLLFFCSCQGNVDKKLKEDYNIVNPQNITKEIGIINDPDGYTNARKEPLSSSQILFKILEGEYFFYTSIEQSNWSKIETLDNKIAYVHNSRIEKINQNSVIVYFSEYYDEDTELDKLKKNIVSINSLDDSIAFYIKEFAYPRLDIIKQSKDTIALSSTDKKRYVEITSGLFEKEKHHIENNENNYIDKIDSKKIYGNDEVPIREIKQLNIKNNGTEFKVDKSVFSNLFEPNFENTEVYIKGNNQLIIFMTNGYGAVNSYKTILIFNNSALLKHITYIPF